MVKALQVFFIVSRQGCIVQRIRCYHTFEDGIPTTCAMEDTIFRLSTTPGWRWRARKPFNPRSKIGEPLRGIKRGEA